MPPNGVSSERASLAIEAAKLAAQTVLEQSSGVAQLPPYHVSGTSKSNLVSAEESQDGKRQASETPPVYRLEYTETNSRYPQGPSTASSSGIPGHPLLTPQESATIVAVVMKQLRMA